MAEQYQYEPLVDGGQMRIMVLHPHADYQAPIQCHLVVVPSNHPGDYIALSYSWGMNADGDASCSRAIKIAGRELGVTQNLFEGLKRIRHAHVPCRIWVDAVCINQGDSGEKSHQVARMSDIYSNASRTIVWLGEGESEEDDLATLSFFKFLTHDLTPILGEEAKHDQKVIREYYPSYEWPGTEGLEEYSWTRNDGRPVHLPAAVSWASSAMPKGERATSFWRDEDLQADIWEIRRLLHALFDRRYFSRRWICQEIYHPAATKLDAMWGPCEFPLMLLLRRQMIAVLDRGSEALENHEGNAGTGYEDSENMDPFKVTLRLGRRFNNLLRVKAEHQAKQESKEPCRDLTLALYLMSGQQCSDPRDRLYGLLSMDPSCGLVPDYHLTAAEAYTNFAKVLVANGLLELIFSNLEHSWRKPYWHEVGHTVPDSPLDGLPSWVPDLGRRFEDTDAQYPRIEATVDAANVLTCKVRSIGVLDTGSSGTQRSLSIAEYSSELHSSDDEDDNSPEAEAGDFICEPFEEHEAGHSRGSHLLVLRSAAPSTDLYTLVRVVDRNTKWPSSSDEPFEVRIQ